MLPVYLSSGLFLGWSLGANDASNVFGTAVGTGMIRFRTAAIYCSVFVILGAVVSGAGATHTLGKLGAVNALAGAFMVAFSAAFTVYGMTKVGHPVSTSQAIVGGILGWNLFSGSLIDTHALMRIAGTWVACPVLAALFAVILYFVVKRWLSRLKPHILVQDSLVRYGLLLAGIFGSYALGANNIANVMGVFVPVADFGEASLCGFYRLSEAQQLFLLGGIAIAVGVFTYSRRVMLTVGGGGIFDLSPVAAFIVVVSHSLVLFMFSSEGLNGVLKSWGLPPLPLVPVSSSQAIVGAVVGIGLLKGGRAIRWRTVGAITVSWITTPIIAAAVCYVSLFFLQNVFQQQTFVPEPYMITATTLDRVEEAGMDAEPLKILQGKRFRNAWRFRRAVFGVAELEDEQLQTLLKAARLYVPPVDSND